MQLNYNIPQAAISQNYNKLMAYAKNSITSFPKQNLTNKIDYKEETIIFLMN